MITAGDVIALAIMLPVLIALAAGHLCYGSEGISND